MLKLIRMPPEVYTCNSSVFKKSEKSQKQHAVNALLSLHIKQKNVVFVHPPPAVFTLLPAPTFTPG